MEVAPSINEILIRTSPGCLCSRMRNMEKMGKSGVIYCLFVAGLFLVIIAKLSMFLCFLLLLGVFYHPPLYNFNCEWDITRSIREVWIKIWIFARTKRANFSYGFLKWSCCFLNPSLTLVFWQVNLFEAFWGSNFTEGVWKWILSWSYFWVWKQVFSVGLPS